MPEFEGAESRREPTGPGRHLYRLVRLLALAGGGLLAGLAVMQVTSIVLRALAGYPIPGDFELIQLGTAVVVFCFLPLTQYGRYNFAVTFLTDFLPRRAQARLALVGSVAMTAIALLLSWRSVLGGIDLRGIGDYTMTLQIPIWWAFVPICLALFCLVLASIGAVLDDLKRARE